MVTLGENVILLLITMSKEIKIIRRSSPRIVTITVDDEDYSKVSKLELVASESEKGHFVIKVSFPRIPLGNILIGSQTGKIVDHIDRDQYNFCKSNLRHLTPLENSLNRGINKNNTSGYKGVTQLENQFEARFYQGDKVHRKKGFKTALEAAHHYDFLVTTFSQLPNTPTNKSLGLIT